jgi:hypothetical protein
MLPFSAAHRERHVFDPCGTGLAAGRPDFTDIGACFSEPRAGTRCLQAWAEMARPSCSFSTVGTGVFCFWICGTPRRGRNAKAAGSTLLWP